MGGVQELVPRAGCEQLSVRGRLGRFEGAWASCGLGALPLRKVATPGASPAARSAGVLAREDRPQPFSAGPPPVRSCAVIWSSLAFKRPVKQDRRLPVT